MSAMFILKVIINNNRSINCKKIFFVGDLIIFKSPHKPKMKKDNKKK